MLSIAAVVVFDIVALLVAVDVNVTIDVWVVTVDGNVYVSVVVERLLTEAFVSVVAVITYIVDKALIIKLVALHLMLSLLQLLL